jgi:hypothetical protein
VDDNKYACVFFWGMFYGFEIIGIYKGKKKLN